jgi:hypothetical protein
MKTVDLLNNLYENLKDEINPTEIYNEGWMLNCVLEQIRAGKIKHSDLIFPAETKWYAEALLPTFFKAIMQRDKLAEKDTHADGIVGHLEIREATKRGVEIQSNCSCLYVTEAKMFSKLSEGTNNIQNFDQCARNVACLMKLVYDGIESKKITEIPQKIGFYVFLPEEQKYKTNRKKEKIFDKIMNKDSIKTKINDRINVYFENGKLKKNYDQKEKELSWAKDNLEVFIKKLDIKLIAWEDLLKDSDIENFYENCKNYNK